MSVLELRCTSCYAPIDPTRGAVQRCVYCGASLMIGGTNEEPALARVYVLRLENCGPYKIDVIKVIRRYTKLALKEAKDLAEGTRSVLAAWKDASHVDEFRADLAAAGAETSTTLEARATTTEPAAALATGTVFLESDNDHLIMVIKVVREHTGLGLKEAKDLVEAAPCVVAEDWELGRAERFRADLRAAGAMVR